MNDVEYWNQSWKEKITDQGVLNNVRKMNYLVGKFLERPQYVKFEKLDIGCGIAILPFYVATLSNMEFLEHYTGIDLSERSVEYGKHSGANIICGDVFTYEFDKKFQVFMFMDSLEHIADHEKLAKRVKELAENDFWIIGNIPLYLSKHVGEFEQEMNTIKLQKFLIACGGTGLENDIYGIYGYPYMFFEAHITK